MAFDQTAGYELPDGLVFENGVYKYSGSASPVGSLNPTVATYYYQTNGDIWFHTGSGGSSAWTPVAGQYVWSRLNSFKFASAANASSILTIAARDLLRITINVTGYSGNGIVSLRLGGVAGAVDSGNNYNSRYLRAAAGSNNNFTDVPTTTTNMLRLASQAITLGRSVSVNLTNNTSVRKMVAILTSSEAGAVGTAPSLDWGQGMWANTTQQIVSVQMIATANNLSIGSSIVVEGMNVL